MKKKEITYIIDDNGCHMCTSHAPNSDGYPTIKDSGKTIKIYRYLYQKQYGNLDSSVYLLHSCDNRRCIALHHLSEGSHQDNIQDMVNKNRHASGERIASSKLTRENVNTIRDSPEISASFFANQYKVSESTIRRARNGVYWK